MRLHHVRADGAFELRAGGGVIVQRLHFRRARLGQRSLGVEHVQLRAGAGVGARLASRKASSASACTVCLRVQNFLRLDEIGIGRAHLQFNLARLVGQIGPGFFVKRPGLDDFAARQHAVENVPTHSAPAFQPWMS